MLEVMQKWCEYQRNLVQITAEASRQYFQAANLFSNGALAPWEVALNTNITTLLTSVQALTTIQDSMMTRGKEMQESANSNFQQAAEQVAQATDAIRQNASSISDQLAEDGSFQQSSHKASRHHTRERWHS